MLRGFIRSLGLQIRGLGPCYDGVVTEMVCYSRGLNTFLMGLMQLASMCDVLIMVWFDIRIYRRKQSLDHLPRLMISHFGHPMAAAVVAAPIRRECEVVFASPFVESERREFMSFLVRNLWLENVNRGPVFVGCDWMYLLSAFTGHRTVLLAAKRMAIPCLNGSVLEPLILIVAKFGERVTSSKSRVDEGSYLVLWEDVYSDTRRKPKKAVVRAAQSMSLSS